MKSFCKTISGDKSAEPTAIKPLLTRLNLNTIFCGSGNLGGYRRASQVLCVTETSFQRLSPFRVKLLEWPQALFCPEYQHDYGNRLSVYGRGLKFLVYIAFAAKTHTGIRNIPLSKSLSSRAGWCHSVSTGITHIHICINVYGINHTKSFSLVFRSATCTNVISLANRERGQ